MSIAQFASAMPRPAPSSFAFTVFGRVEANGLVASGNDVEFNIGSPGPNASCDVAIWVIQTSTNCYIRVGINDDPSPVNTWYNTAGVSQGDPGNTNTAGATVYELGEQCDTVKIDHTETTDSGGPTFTNPPSGGSYTDNVAFSPTQDTKYGREIQVFSTSSPAGDAEQGTVTFAVTFSKAGYEDATVTFEIRAASFSSWEP